MLRTQQGMKDQQRTRENEGGQFETLQYQAQAAGHAAMTTCPNCGAQIDEDADFCEMCRTYVRHDVCSFCGAHLEPDNAFCPECGNPRGGIVCPQCNTLNDFAFCKQCGAPLTDEARTLVAQMHETAEFRQLQKVVNQLARTGNIIPVTTQEQMQAEQANKALRERVLRMLAEDAGVKDPVITDTPRQIRTQEEINKAKAELTDQIMHALEKMAVAPTASPAKARNYAMAAKPGGIRLAWMCNYKHAVHSSPCGCAKPQLGGKWIILGKGMNITND